MPERGTASKKKRDKKPEETMFMVEKQEREEEDVDSRKGMKTSEEISVFEVGDAPVIDYVAEQKQKIIEYDEESEVIELDSESMESVDVSSAKTVELDGKSLRYDLDKKLKADFKALKEVKYDDRRGFQDIKRNIEEYRLLCGSCRNTLKCPKCDGKGKIMLMRKCPDCGGSGMCGHCAERGSVRCPSCSKKLSVYATSCSECGTAFACPNCFAPIPSTATRCLACRTEFYCKNCDNVIAPGVDSKCSRCGTEKWFAKHKRELQIRQDEKSQ
jgi:RecJ-like exonuclease